MPIEFYCPLGHRLRAPKRKAGQEVRCPLCNERAIVPMRQAGGQPPGTSGSGDTSDSAGRAEAASLSPQGPIEIATAAPPGRPRRPVPLPLPLAGQPGLGSSVGEASQEGPRSPVPPPLVGPYRPDAGRVQRVRWLAALLALVVGLSTVPAWEHLDLQSAPNWARIVLLIAALQAFYIVWMLAAPDWASVWVVMLVFAFVSALYGMATAIALGTPPSRPMPLGIGELRHAAPQWCGAVLAAMLLATYCCGCTSAGWRRWYERQLAAR